MNTMTGPAWAITVAEAEFNGANGRAAMERDIARWKKAREERAKKLTIVGFWFMLVLFALELWTICFGQIAFLDLGKKLGLRKEDFEARARAAQEQTVQVKRHYQVEATEFNPIPPLHN
ncbi:MAG: hypothetical protein WC797_01140 [Candidatus Paceibacterota bacterium]|jgi:hypothetical protein